MKNISDRKEGEKKGRSKILDYGVIYLGVLMLMFI